MRHVNVVWVLIGALPVLAAGSPGGPVISAPLLTAGPVPGTALRLHPGDAIEVRVVVRRPGRKRILAAGPWQTASRWLRLPPDLQRRGLVGGVEVTAEGRDPEREGVVQVSTPVLWSLMPPPAPPTILHRVRTKRPWVAITVDDGNNEASIKRMIAAARRLRTQLTFCFSGRFTNEWSVATGDAVRRAVKDGVIEACNHG